MKNEERRMKNCLVGPQSFTVLLLYTDDTDLADFH